MSERVEETALAYFNEAVAIFQKIYSGAHVRACVKILYKFTRHIIRRFNSGPC